MPSVSEVIREYVLREFLPGEDPKALGDSMPLLSSGVLDSVALIKLVSYLEQHYGIELKPHEVTPDRFDTISQMSAALQKKLAATEEQ